MRANRAATEARAARSTGSARRLVASALAEAIKRAARGEGRTNPPADQDERGFPVGMDEDVKQALTEAGLDRANFDKTMDRLLGRKAGQADPGSAESPTAPGAAPADPGGADEPPSHLPEELRELLRTAGWRQGDPLTLEKNEDGSMSFTAAIRDRPGVKNEAVVEQIAALKAKAPKGSVVTVAVIGPDSNEPRDADGFPVGIDPHLKALMQQNGLAPAKSHHVDASDAEAMGNRVFSALLPQQPGAELQVTTVRLSEADAGELHALMNSSGAPRVAHMGRGFMNLQSKDDVGCDCAGCKLLRTALPLFQRGEVLRTQAVTEDSDGYRLVEEDVQH